MIADQIIEITHLINPHLFWFKNKSNAQSDLNSIESELKKYVAGNGDEKRLDGLPNDACSVGDIIAVFYVAKSKWIRAVIDVIDDPNESSELIVWAIDYGIPLKISPDQGVVLDSKLRELCSYENHPSNIRKGGIHGIIPAKIKISASKEKRVFPSEHWDSTVNENLQKIVFNSTLTLTFRSEFETDAHVFGHLGIGCKDNGKKDVAEIIRDKLCMARDQTSSTFKTEIPNSASANINRWLSNDGKNNCKDNFVKTNDDSISGACSTSSGSVSSISVGNNEEKVDQLELCRKFNSMHVARSLQSSKSNESPAVHTNGSQSRMGTINALQKINRNIASKSLTNPREIEKAPSVRTSEKTETISSKSSTVLSNSQTNHPQSPAVRFAHQNEELVSKVKLIPIMVKNNDEDQLDTVNLANFTPSVHKAMKKLGLTETYATQGYAWPNLTRGNSVILVDSENRGKTIAYLPALCTIVQRASDEQDKEMNDKTKEDGVRRSKSGATAIIVTSNVTKVAELSRNLMNMPMVSSKVIASIGTRDAATVTTELYNGCNILVITAPCLAEILSRSPHLIKTEKLKCIAFENIDCIMEKQEKFCKTIIKDLCTRRSYKGDPKQFIITSRTWQSYLPQFMSEKLIADSVLLIGNYLEASFSAGILSNFTLCSKQVKLEKTIEHIQNLPYKKERTMIVCNEAAEAEQVAKTLEGKKVPHELVKDVTSSYAQSKIASFWSKIEGILICTDEHLEGTKIRNVQHIVHYSLPTGHFKQFLKRLSSMLDFFMENFTTDLKSTSTLLLDEDNFLQLPKIVDWLTRDKQSIPKELAELSHRARLQNKMDKAKQFRYKPICDMLCMHGMTEHKNCNQRHTIVKEDIIEDNSKVGLGELRFSVLKVISPTEYIVRPKMSRAGGADIWQIANKSDEFEDLDKRMQIHYKEADNQKVLESPSLGQKCVIIKHERFHRAEIIQIIEKRSLTDVERFEVRYVDTGKMEILNSFDLYKLEETFSSPSQAYHLHLSGIVPADNEDEWDPFVIGKLQENLNQLTETESDVTYEAHVVFALRNTIVVDIMRAISVNMGIVHCSIKKYIFENKYGKSAPEKLNAIIEMAKLEGAKITKIQKATPAVDTTSNESNNIKEPSNTSDLSTTNSASSNVELYLSPIPTNMTSAESSIDSGIEPFDENWKNPWRIQHKSVQISHFNAPNDFYVTEHSNQIERLYKAIDEYAHANIKSSLDDSMRELDVDKYCLVCLDGGYNRAKTTSVVYGDEIEFEVFLLDTGRVTWVKQHDAFDIPDHLIEIVPFQAIWCNFVGIKKGHDENGETAWTDSDSDEIYYFIDHLYTKHEIILHIVSTDRTIKSKVPNTKLARNDVVLLTALNNEQLNINEMLVTNNMAVFDPETQEKLMNIPIVIEEDWDNDCEPVIESKLPTIPDTDDESNNTDWILENMDGLDDFVNELYKQQIRTSEENPAVEPIAKNVLESGADISDNNRTLYRIHEEAAETELEDQETEKGSTGVERHALEYIYKRPSVNWWQDDETLVLRINAYENVKYGLVVTSNYIIYSTVENDNEIVAKINLFADIEHEQTTHEVRGLNVIVRLHKSCPIMWPQLMHTADKYTWIKEDTDALKEHFNYQRVMRRFEHFGIDSDNDEESEEYVPPPEFEDDGEEQLIDD